MYSINKASEMLGVSISTLRRWEKEGKITSIKTEGGHRRYTIEQLNKLIKKKEPKRKKVTIGYCRVSSSDQREDLNRQIETVSSFCAARGYMFRIIEDLGSGLSYNKKGLQELLSLIQSNQVDKIVVNYKDRLIRFGYELVEQMCDFHGVEIEVINQTENKTYEQELVEDILSIITVSSSRLYGSRSHKQKKIIKVVEDLLNE